MHMEISLIDFTAMRQLLYQKLKKTAEKTESMILVNSDRKNLGSIYWLLTAVVLAF